mgnify:CR=1 FL=1
MHTFTPMNGWKPLAERDPTTADPWAKEPDPRDKPIEYSLTPAERDVAILARLELEKQRRQKNRDDDAAAAARALESEDY